ncbi:hypothetical protein HMPREF9278_0533 [Mobiluncus mulieris FB024-16]|nr:hypothetical protein HMPREF9278_0533 [Mobiluncus mulieris FB024-16]
MHLHDGDNNPVTNDNLFPNTSTQNKHAYHFTGKPAKRDA